MRTIKFRGKRLNNGDWVYGSLTQNEAHNKNGEAFMVSYIAPSIPAASEGGFELVKMDRVTPATVGQFTGLYDKNGNEIYEGDIVAEEAFKRVISFIPEAAAFCSCSPYESSIRTRTSADEMRYYEVVGNVFDNPELLEKGGKK